MWWFVVIACACSSKVAPAGELAAIEKAIDARMIGVVLAPSGKTYVDGVVVDDVHFPEALAKTTSKTDPLSVWLLADRHPAVNTIAALQVIAERYPRVRLLTTSGTSTVELCARAELTREPTSDPEVIRLSILVDTERTWLGLTRVDEFQDIPKLTSGHDYQKLEKTLGDHKTSAFFTDRSDLEIGAEPRVPGEAYAFAVAAACRAGFTKLAILRGEQVSARPR